MNYKPYLNNIFRDQFGYLKTSHNFIHVFRRRGMKAYSIFEEEGTVL